MSYTFRADFIDGHEIVTLDAPSLAEAKGALVVKLEDENPGDEFFVTCLGSIDRAPQVALAV